MKFFLVTAMLLSVTGAALAQEDIPAKHAAYYRCANHIAKDPHQAYECCSDYLNKYPNDDPRLVDYAGGFVTAYRKISQYVQSVLRTDFAETTASWAVYSPGLLKKIPDENSPHLNYPILIKREYGSPYEEKLLAKAEALYKNPEPIQADLLKQWGYFAQKSVVLPDGEPKWWAGTSSTILSTELVSTEAVLYYYKISQEFRNNAGKLKENSFRFLSSSLKYDASIKKWEVYERPNRSFRNVYVANMTLTWAQICGDLCGSGFTRNKVVVMSLNGEILEIFLDDPVNRSSWIS